MSRPQPYRIDWTVQPQSLEDCSRRLGTNFESIDQMFQALYEEVQRLEALIASGGASPAAAATGPLMAQMLLRVFIRG